MKKMNDLIAYLINEKLVLATAESCTAGEILALLAKHEQCGQCVSIGYVVYSLEAKLQHLNVKQSTVDTHTLTSEEVAREMVLGVFEKNDVQVVIATTGITGDKAMDGIPPGTICFAWGFKINGKIFLFSETQQFAESRKKLPEKAAKYALSKVIKLHKKAEKLLIN